MSFWDHIKPATKAPTATQIKLEQEGGLLLLSWDDGQQTQLLARALRQACPCAECVEEWSGKRTFHPDDIPSNLRILSAAPVGNYALSFAFSDAHRTGIFNWTLLRSLTA